MTVGHVIIPCSTVEALRSLCNERVEVGFCMEVDPQKRVISKISYHIGDENHVFDSCPQRTIIGGHTHPSCGFQKYFTQPPSGGDFKDAVYQKRLFHIVIEKFATWVFQVNNGLQLLIKTRFPQLLETKLDYSWKKYVSATHELLEFMDAVNDTTTIATLEFINRPYSFQSLRNYIISINNCLGKNIGFHLAFFPKSKDVIMDFGQIPCNAITTSHPLPTSKAMVHQQLKSTVCRVSS